MLYYTAPDVKEEGQKEGESTSNERKEEQQEKEEKQKPELDKKTPKGM